MKITKRLRTITTYIVEMELKATRPTYDTGRGLRYWPDMDDLAVTEARSMYDGATSTIRGSAKVADLAVALQIEERESGLWAVFSATVNLS